MPDILGWRNMGLITRFLLICAGALLLAGLIARITDLRLPIPPGQTQQDRERALSIMQEELASLPPPAGAVEQGDLPNTDPGHGPSLDVSYSSSAPCQDVQTYYLSTAREAGWTVEQRPPSDAGRIELDSTYQKKVTGFTITMVITCYTDPTKYGSGYLLNMRA